MKATTTNKARAAAGFTILEVLIGVLVLTIGMIGIFGMQALAVQTNRAAYDMRVATELAETTLERLSLDSMEWTAAGAWPTSTYLEQGMTSEAAWTAPPFPNDDGSIPTFNDLGLPAFADGTVADDRQGLRNSRYCMRYRLSWIRVPRLLRAEVQVVWPRTRGGEAILGEDCANLDGIEDAVLQRNFQTVQATTMLGSNPVLL